MSGSETLAQCIALSGYQEKSTTKPSTLSHSEPVIGEVPLMEVLEPGFAVLMCCDSTVRLLRPKDVVPRKPTLLERQISVISRGRAEVRCAEDCHASHRPVEHHCRLRCRGCLGLSPGRQDPTRRQGLPGDWMYLVPSHGR